MMRKLIWVFIVAILFFSISPAYAANLLTNPGFDTGAMSPWIEASPGNTDASITIEQFLSPDYSAKFMAGNTVNAQTLTLKQGVVISPNVTYYASAYLYSLEDSFPLRDGAKAWVSLDWYTAKNGTKLGSITSNYLTSYNSDWEFFEASGVAPGTANYAIVYLNMSSPAMSNPKRITYFDDAWVSTTSAVPEPASLSLLGLGLLGLLGLKRRRA